MLPECVVMSAFSSSFNLSKKFRKNFISVSQTQIGESADGLNNVQKLILWQANTVSLQFNISEDWNFHAKCAL